MIGLPDNGVVLSNQGGKPLCRLQAYLRETKTSMGLFREVLLEVKDLLVVVTIILFFVVGVYEALGRLLG
jgi:hypothetical protein